jgi:hypothetical protein
MPIPDDELSVFFDRHCDEMRAHWERMVDRGQLSELTKDRRVTRMEEIGAMLRALAEGQAVLTYQQRPPRAPSPLIFLRPEKIDDL